MFQQMEKRIADQVSARIEEVIIERMKEVDKAFNKSLDTFIEMNKGFGVIMEFTPKIYKAIKSYDMASQEATKQLERALDEGKRIEQLQNEVVKLQKIIRQKEKQLRMLGKGE